MGEEKTFQEPKITRDPVLRFTPYSWAKLKYLCHVGKTEIAGYGITGTEDPLLVTDFLLIKQECTSASFEFDEKDSNDFIDKMMDLGIPPWACQRILIHTHPGESPDPSQTDEENFDKYFSHPHWAIFFILAKGGKTYCRIRHNVGPGIEVYLKTDIDYSMAFPGSNFEKWEEEYKNNVQEKIFDTSILPPHDWSNLWDEYEKEKRWNEMASEEWEKLVDNEDEEDLETELEEDHVEVFIEDGEIHLWDDETQEYYTYDPETKHFLKDSETEEGQRVFYVPDPEPSWMRKVRKFAAKQLVGSKK